MIKNVRVIEILVNKVVQNKDVLVGYQLQENEEFSLTGEVGQIKQEDGTFIDDPQDLINQTINNEITELNQWLDLRRNIEHSEKAVKQARLLELLG